jgi:CHAD domain-containing protein
MVRWRDGMTLLKRTQKNWRHFAGAWKRSQQELDEKNVHDLRVAGRRLLASLNLVLAASGQDSGKALRRLKRVVKKLGVLRDLQVQLRILESIHLKTDTEAFRSYLASEERKERRKLKGYLRLERRKKVRDSLKSMLNRTDRHLDVLSESTVRARVRTAIRSHRASFREAQRNESTSNPNLLHAARISARKLRYSLEAAEPVLGPASKAELELLQRKQTELGHIRDLYVARQRYRQWAERFRKRRKLT